jgi:hypothetical protein
VKPSEIAELVTMLAAAYPHTQFGEASASVYEMALADIDPTVFRSALVRLVQTSKFMPTIAEIREACVVVRVGARRPGGEAWGQVYNAIKRHGIYKQPGVDFQFLDPLTDEVVKEMGWRLLCTSEHSQSDRARFIELYEAKDKLQRADAQASPNATTPALEARNQKALAAARELVDGVTKKLTAPKNA